MISVTQLKNEIQDLSRRLYYCSDTGEGRKIRKVIEKAIRQKEQELEQLFIKEGCLDYQYQTGEVIRHGN